MFEETAKKAITLCLQEERLSHKYSVLAWQSLLLVDPVFKLFQKHMEEQAPETVEQLADHIICQKALTDNFLMCGLARLIPANPELEFLFKDVRRIFLNSYKAPSTVFLPFIRSLALYNFFNEYIQFVTPEEQKHVDQLETEISNTLKGEGNEELLNWQVAIYGCYQPVIRHPQADDILKRLENDNSRPPFLRLFINVHLKDFVEERKIASSLPTFGKIEDDISVAVQKQYEENPYPRWRAIQYTQPNETLRNLTKGRHLLVAGCGTGQEAVNVAQHAPDAEITAIDLSRASLSYATRQTKERGIQNVTFKHGDILQVKELDQQFDMVFSSGVLHHMKNPDAGIAALLGVLRPGGIMRMALYSDTARRNLDKAQKVIKDENYPAGIEGIRQFRKDYYETYKDDAEMKDLINCRAFYNTSECRDLIFHVQEHRYTIAKLRELLQTHNLHFLGFRMHDQYFFTKYRNQNPDDLLMTKLDRIEQFEKENPQIFSNMYNFWVCRKEDKNRKDLMQRTNYL
jgi:ubiquinone/menaquinone biosynthesis C-methylase UbiE